MQRITLATVAASLALALPLGAGAGSESCTPTKHCRNSIEYGIGRPPEPAQLCDTPPGWTFSYMCIDRVPGKKTQHMQIGGIPGQIQCVLVGNKVMFYGQTHAMFVQFEYWFDGSKWALETCWPHP